MQRSSAASDIASEAGTNASGLGMGQLVDGAGLQEDALQEIVAKLRKQPKKILPVLHLVRKDQKETGGRKAFPLSYIRLAQLPRDYVMDLIATNSGEPGLRLSSQDLDAIERSSKGTLHDLLWRGTGLSPHCKWPKCAHDVSIVTKVLTELHNQNGQPWHSIPVLRPKKGVLVIDWDKFGAFQFVPPGDSDLHLPDGVGTDGVVKMFPLNLFFGDALWKVCAQERYIKLSRLRETQREAITAGCSLAASGL